MDLNWDNILDDSFDSLKDSIAEPTEKIFKLKKGERRDAAIIFLDLKGFTAMSTTLDSEQVVEIINSTFVLFTKVIEKYMGYVDKYEGDAIMAIFGGKKATEKDTENAIRAGLEMFQVLQKVNIILKEKDRSLAMRIGVNFGEVMVTEIGHGEAIDETVYGNAVNLAARLEPISPPGKIMVTTETKNIVNHIFDFEFFGYRELKGIDGEVELWTVSKLKDKEIERWQRSQLVTEKSYIGREKQLEFLKQSYLKCEKLKGENQNHHICLIKATAGMGKSRFAHEFTKRIKSENNNILSINAHTASFYPPNLYIIIDFIKKCANVPAPVTISKAKFEEMLYSLKNDDNEKIIEDIKPILGYLLKIKYDDERFKYLKGENLFNEVKTAVLKFIKIIADNQKKPLIISFDDLHWLDEMSASVLEFVFENLETEIPVFFILLHRLEYEIKNKTINEHINETIILPELTDVEITNLISKLLPDCKITKSVMKQIIAKSAGNPFYAEEFVQLLLDRKFVTYDNNQYKITGKLENLNVPNTLKSLIMSRIDFMKFDLKETLKTASVIGETFLLKSLEFVVKYIEHLPSDDLNENLGVIEELKYVLEKSSDNIFSYIFKDHLVHQTIYETILFQNRKILHRLAAESLEEAAVNSDDYICEIADHYYCSDKPERAKKWINKAIDYTIKQYYTENALMHIEHLLELTNSPEEENKILFKKGNVLEIRGNWVEAEKIYVSLISCNNDLLSAQSLLDLGRLKISSGDNKNAEKILLKAYAAAKKLNNIKWMIDALRLCGNIYLYSQQYQKAEEIYNKALQTGEHFKISESKGKIINNLGLILEKKTMYAKALQFYQKAMEISQNDKIEKSRILGNIANLFWIQNKFDKAESFYRKQLGIVMSIPFREGIIKAAGNLATCLLYQMKDDEAMKYYSFSLKYAKDAGDKFGICFAMSNIADIYRYAGKNDKAIPVLMQTIKLAEKISDNLQLAVSFGNLGDIFKAKKDYDKSETYYQKAIQIGQKYDLKFQLCYFHLVFAELLMFKNMNEEAKIQNNLAIQIAEEAKRDDVLQSAKMIAEKLNA